MARTPSTMLPLGTEAPEFSLPDTDGTIVLRQHVAGRHGLLVMFICNHCPYVHLVREELAALGRDYPAKGIGVVAIMSNDVTTHPGDSPARMAEEKARFGYAFPYLYDASQEVAKAYRAACTPDFFLFDNAFKLVYRGQLDDARPGNGVPVTGKDLRAALDALLAGAPPLEVQQPSLGCNIKWKAGSAPSYAG
ncbi:MAG: thioredoxin family protein [Candidatus Hydrogenedentes bacterium]|nr:thioredoxin family protein [Candidatus Hydrogenedentota bacterium]